MLYIKPKKLSQTVLSIFTLLLLTQSAQSFSPAPDQGDIDAFLATANTDYIDAFAHACDKANQKSSVAHNPTADNSIVFCNPTPFLCDNITSPVDEYYATIGNTEAYKAAYINKYIAREKIPSPETLFCALDSFNTSWKAKATDLEFYKAQVALHERISSVQECTSIHDFRRRLHFSRWKSGKGIIPQRFNQ